MASLTHTGGGHPFSPARWTVRRGAAKALKQPRRHPLQASEHKKNKTRRQTCELPAAQVTEIPDTPDQKHGRFSPAAVLAHAKKKARPARTKLTLHEPRRPTKLHITPLIPVVRGGALQIASLSATSTEAACQTCKALPYGALNSTAPAQRAPRRGWLPFQRRWALPHEPVPAVKN